ncbi:cardiomyopathy-associated protein 5 [Syngnathus acus]|uniref:cardiomyopathy-associated protein 5 n=1 Tax=Syngnathus acus TaxID=161584 RepID=UPI001886268E|nr:cardiomyopathy-associated protein 5 [Syngnathus acus]
MEALTGDDDVDTEMQVLTPDDVAKPDRDAVDEVENLQNSLREAVHDDNVRPKMQCLVMDTSFSMVTMQSEDSGIAWETTPSRCSTSWAPKAEEPAEESGPPAGRIIFVMDEELMSRRKKSEAEGQKRERSDNRSEKPDLVGLAPLHVKDEGDEEEERAPRQDKEQRLFSLVSEGSEILNIVVPHKLASVDEEESKAMVDNLSYLEEGSASKADDKEEETCDKSFEQDSKPREDASAESLAQAQPTPPVADPPGAPVARPPGKDADCNVDYFEAFALIDDHAPGSPAVVPPKLGLPVPEEPVQGEDATTGEDHKSPDAALTSEALEEFFYSGTDDYLTRSHPDSEDPLGEPKVSPPPSKLNGCTLFGSQENILTPVFLPEGPPKIIDPVLLEEPKALAFLYNDLYEEATGSRKKEEDTESVTSEKSFHSRHSDREARGYLEKYVLIDETPVVEAQPVLEHRSSLLSKGFAEFPSTSPECEMPNSEEEITDFFRSSASSSPCDIKNFVISREDDESPSPTSCVTETGVGDTGIPEGPIDVFETSSEPDWEGMDVDDVTSDDIDTLVRSNQQMWLRDSEVVKPCPPPRRKTRCPLKERLALAPLTPAEDTPTGEKQREDETETQVKTSNEKDENQEVSLPSHILQGNTSVDITDEKPIAREDIEVALTQVQLKAPESEKVHLEKQDHLATLPIKPSKTNCVIL